MENYIVSARKYRPKTFQDVVGQQHITETLERAIGNSHLAQALLFCGPRGVGKTTCARIVARRINEVSGGDPSHDYSLNIFELDAASNNSVDDMRHLIEQVRYSPQIGQFKVYIIDEVHMLSASAFNAFLKTLEEPPSHAIFILATTEKHKIIPTILSRCQIFDFKRIEVADIAKHLAYVAENEGIKAEPDALHLIAQKGDGALRDSLSIFDRVASFSDNNITYQVVIDNLNILDYDYYFKTIDLILKEDAAGIYVLFDSILKKGFDSLLYVNGLSSHVRDLMMCKDPQTIELLEVGDNIKERYLAQSKACNLHQIFHWLNVLNQCDINYKSSNNKRLTVEIALSQMQQFPTRAEKKKPESDVVEPVKTESKRELVHEEKKTPKAESKETLEKNTSVTDAPKEPIVLERKKSTKPLNLRNKGSLKGTGYSLSGLNTKKDSVVNESTKVESNSHVYGTQTFTLEDLLAKWKNFAEQYKDNNSLFAVLSKEPKISENHKIKFDLESASQQGILEEKKIELVQFLRKELNNGQIDIELFIKEGKDVKLIYTPEEKFKFMAEKNPALLKLKKRFDLEY